MLRNRAVWKAEAPWLFAFVALSVAYTWPLAAHFTTQLAGDHGDGWQNLWNIDWIRRSLWAGRNPFFTHDLWAPDGATLVFQTFDLPDAVWSAPLIGLLGPWATYNLVMLGTFVFSGWAMYALGRGLGASRPAAFLSGCAYTFSTYHFAHTLGHLHIVAMQWVPLFALAWWKVLEEASWRWAVAGGVFLVLASLASWYYLLGSFLIAAGTGVVWLIHTRGKRLFPVLPRLMALCAVYLVLIGPLGLAMVRTRAAEPVNGEHQAAWFSADLQSFFFPNAAQALAALNARHLTWSGNAAETATYLGYGLLLLVVAGLVLRAPRVGSYLLVALGGFVLALGPRLVWGGHQMTRDVLPYVYAEKGFPLLQFMGVPVRFGFAATFGLAAALAPSLDVLAKRLRWWAVAPLAVLAVVEHVPHAFVTSAFPVPPPMLAWAKDPSDFVVLDSCRDMRPLWHQVLHHHPIMGGYLTRTPARLEAKLQADPVAGVLWAWDAPSRTSSLTSDRIDFPFERPVVEGAEPEHFSFDLEGELNVPRSGRAIFSVESDDSAELFIDAHRVVDNRGAHPLRKAEVVADLQQGMHRLRVRYEQYGGGAFLKASWQPPGEARRVLATSDVPGGFHGRVSFRRRELSISRAQALAHLHRLKVRYVVQMEEDSRYPMESQLGLRPIYERDGIRIYEIPQE